MLFKQLYNLCQNASVPISRNFIKKHTLEITKSAPISHFAADLDINYCRGFFLSTKDDHQFIRQANGNNVIVTARGLNKCWQRFIFIKEMMHLFDEEYEYTSTQEEFTSLLSDLSESTVKKTPQFSSEIKAFWMALAILCPTKEIQKAKQELSNNSLNNYEIALRFRIPDQYVPLILSDSFQEQIELILNN